MLENCQALTASKSKETKNATLIQKTVTSIYQTWFINWVGGLRYQGEKSATEACHFEPPIRLVVASHTGIEKTLIVCWHYRTLQQHEKVATLF